MSKSQKTAQKVVPLHTSKKKITMVYAILAAVVVGICIYQIFKINYSPVQTEAAFEKTISNTVLTDAFVVRDETYIRAEASGTLVPLVADGKRVARGDDVAVVFTTEASARTYVEIQSLQADIAYFESLKNKIGIQAIDVESLENRIYSACESYVLATRSGNMDEYEAYEDILRESITSRQLSTGTVIDPTEKLAQLRARLAELQAQAGGYTTVQADNPGYYISHVDGYENVFDYDMAKTATGEEISTLLQAAPASEEQLQGCMGKLVDSFNWYLLCEIDAEAAAMLEAGRRITVEFPLSAAKSVSAQVVSVQSAGEGMAAVVLQSNLMNPQYAGLRKEQVRLVLQNFTGLQVNNKAIREVDGEKGVFVLSGNIVKFKKIYIAHSDDRFSVCVTPTDEDGNYKSGYIELYDEIIVEGTDLYDGKIMG